MSQEGSSEVKKIAILGCLGRMGQRLCILAARGDDNMKLVGALQQPSHPMVGQPLSACIPGFPADKCNLSVQGELSELSEKPDVLIDFSAPNGTMRVIPQAAAKGISLVIGTTGLTREQEALIHGPLVAGVVPVIYAMNYSLGVNLMIRMASDVAKCLGEEFNIEIVEAHHNRKVDAPSGTALAVADGICGATGRTREDVVCGRSGQTGKRSTREVGMHSLRLGNVVGEHTVSFASDFERLEITHKAQDRDVFAVGALKAALWVKGKPPGMYTMGDVLFGMQTP